MAGIRTAEEYVYEYVREQILGGKLRGGQRLDQDAIAQSLSVSRMPVREAIKHLHSDGFVVSVPHRGATVTALNSQSTLELFEVRAVLEGLAVSLTLRAMPADAFAKYMRQLRGALVKLNRSRANHLLWLQRHEDFHETLCQCSDKPHLGILIRRLRHSLAPYLRLYLTEHENAEVLEFEHDRLVTAIEAGDPVAAEKSVREHVRSAAKGVSEFLKRAETADPPATSRRRSGPHNGPSDRSMPESWRTPDGC